MLHVGAVQVYGLPSRIRTDQGLENVEIARMILEQRGMDRASVYWLDHLSTIKESKDSGEMFSQLWHSCALPLLPFGAF